MHFKYVQFLIVKYTLIKLEKKKNNCMYSKQND